MAELPIHIDKDGALNALIGIVEGFRAGRLTNEQAAALLDDLLDTGPWDAMDDPLFVGLVTGLDALVPDSFSLWTIFDRDPAKMRARADKVEAEGNPEKAARIRARADKVESQQQA
jgi:hypothetical protein